MEMAVCSFIYTALLDKDMLNQKTQMLCDISTII